MIYERSSGAIMASIKKNSNEEEFLLLHHTAGHWDFPKGNIEVGEDEIGSRTARDIRRNRNSSCEFSRRL